MIEKSQPKLPSSGNPQIRWVMATSRFCSMYCYKKYVELAFMRGGTLTPVVPVAAKQASALPGHDV